MPQKSTECKGLFFPLDQFKGLFSLSPEQQSKVFFACLEYHIGKEPDLSDPVVCVAFSMMKGSFDRSLQKIVEVANMRSEAGKRSAEVRATKRAIQTNTNKPNNGEQTDSKRTINLTKLNKSYSPISPKGEQDKIDSLCDTGTRASSADSGSDEPQNTFVKPTLEQVAAYVQEKGIDIDPAEFIAANERRNWTVMGKPMKSWTRVLQTWRQKRQSDQIATEDELFEAVWNEYPRKENKSAAFRAFKDAQKKGLLPEDLVRRVHARKYSNDWLKDDGRFVPQLEKWLNNGGWNDAACDYGDPELEDGWEEELAELSELSRMFNDGNPKPGETLAETYARIEKYEPLYIAKRNDMIARGCRCV